MTIFFQDLERGFYNRVIRPTLMGTKNLYENGPNPFFLFGTKDLVRPTLMETKNLYENGPNPGEIQQ